MPALTLVISMEYSSPGLLQSRISCVSVTCKLETAKAHKTGLVNAYLRMLFSISYTLAVFGPTEANNCTVKLTARVFLPSSSVSHSPKDIFSVLRIAWKSIRNLDFEKSKLNSVSTLMGSIVCTN